MLKNYSLNIKSKISSRGVIIFCSLVLGIISFIFLKFLNSITNIHLDDIPISLTIIFFTLQSVLLKFLFVNNKNQKNNQIDRKKIINASSKEVNKHLIGSILRFITTIIFFFIIIRIYKLDLFLYTIILIFLYLIFSIFDMCLTLIKLCCTEE